MRSSPLLSVVPLAVFCLGLAALPVRAATPVVTPLLHDAFTASDKNAGLSADTNGFLAPTSSQAVWYGGGTAPQYTAGSDIKMSAGNRALLAYITPSTSVDSLEVGETLTATVTFKYTSGTGAFSVGDFRMGFLNSGGNGGPTNTGAADGSPVPAPARIAIDNFSLTAGGDTPRGYSGYFADSTAAPSASSNSISFWRRSGGPGRSQQWLGPTSSDVVPTTTMSQISLSGGGTVNPIANNGTVYVATFAVTYVTAPTLNDASEVVAPGTVQLSYTITSGADTVMSYAVTENSDTPFSGFDAFAIFSTYNAAIQVSDLLITRTSIAPEFTTQPESQAVAIGGDVTFTADATGAPAPTYQWWTDRADGKTFVKIAGATSDTLTLTNLTRADAGHYKVGASNSATTKTGPVYSDTATLTVLTVPEITGQPVAATIYEGQNTTFTATARGAPTLAYQWQKDGVDLTDGGTISGATTAALTFTRATLADAGSYVLYVTNTYGTAHTAAVTLTVNEAIAPEFTTQPAAQSVFEGADVQFAVTLTGTTPFTFQWFKDGVALTDGGQVSGATTATLTLTAVRLAEAGDYSVTVSNVANPDAPITSATATLAVNAAPTPAAPVAIAARDVVETSFTARWERATNAVAYRLDVSTDPSFATFVSGYEDIDVGSVLSQAVTGLAVDSNYYYRVRAYNSTGTSGSSNVIAVSTTSPVAPVITSVDRTVFTVGVPGTFAVTATGNPAPFFTASGLPDWLALDATTGVLSGTAPAGTAGGSYAFTITAANDKQPDATQYFTVQVQAAPGVEEPLTVTTLAGGAGVEGAIDAAGTAARFRFPTGVTVNADGDIFLADTGNHTIRKITADGTATTFAGTAGTAGSANGTGTAATFNTPAGVAADAHGNLYVADTLNHVIRKISSAGAVTTLAGKAGAAGSVDGTGSAARFYAPQALALNHSGSYLYVADTNNDTIRRITLATGKVTTFAGSAGLGGSADGTGAAARFNAPSGLAVDLTGQIFVADTDNHTIRLITSAGVTTTLAGRAGSAGAADGVANVASFRHPSALAVDGDDNLYVLDTDNHTVRKVVSALGLVSTIAGSAGTSGTADGQGSAVRFNDPTGIAVGPDGGLVIADTDNHTVRVGILPAIPVIETQPQNVTVTVDSPASFSVTASGSPTPSYQWFHGASLLPGETRTTLSFTTVTSADAGEYTVVISNAMGSVTSNTVTLTVNPNPDKTPTPAGISSGGGGAPSAWFGLALALLVSARFVFRRPRFISAR